MMKCTKCRERIRCDVSIHAEEANSVIETSYQWWHCPACGTKYYGILEDDHGNMMDDRVRHTGYIIAEEVWQKTLAWAKQCPDELNSSCKCVVHRAMPPSGFYGEHAWYTYD